MGVPNAPKTPLRSIRIDDELWEAAKVKAAQQGETVTQVIRDALARYLADDADGAPHEPEGGR